jgi:hypothetical protein
MEASRATARRDPPKGVSNIVASHGEKVEGHEPQPLRRGSLAGEYGSVDRDEVLCGFAVTLGEYDELTVKRGSTRDVRKSADQRAQPSGQVGAAPRPPAHLSAQADVDQESEAVPLRLEHPPSTVRPAASGDAEHRLGAGIGMRLVQAVTRTNAQPYTLHKSGSAVQSAASGTRGSRQPMVRRQQWAAAGGRGRRAVRLLLDAWSGGQLAGLLVAVLLAQRARGGGVHRRCFESRESRTASAEFCTDRLGLPPFVALWARAAP